MPEREKRLPKSFWEDDRWLHEHYDQLSRQYPDKWVAVVDKTVAAVGESIGEVKTLVEEKTGKRNVPVMFIEKGIHIYGNLVTF